MCRRGRLGRTREPQMHPQPPGISGRCWGPPPAPCGLASPREHPGARIRRLAAAHTDALGAPYTRPWGWRAAHVRADGAGRPRGASRPRRGGGRRVLVRDAFPYRGAADVDTSQGTARDPAAKGAGRQSPGF